MVEAHGADTKRKKNAAEIILFAWRWLSAARPHSVSLFLDWFSVARRSKILNWIPYCLSKKLSRCFAAPKTHHIGLHGVRLCWAVGVVKKKKLREPLRCIFQPEYSINCQVLSGESVHVIPKAISPKDSQILRRKSSQKYPLCNSANSADTHSLCCLLSNKVLYFVALFFVVFFGKGGAGGSTWSAVRSMLSRTKIAISYLKVPKWGYHLNGVA